MNRLHPQLSLLLALPAMSAEPALPADSLRPMEQTTLGETTQVRMDIGNVSGNKFTLIAIDYAGNTTAGTISLASARCPRGGTAMFALMALAGDLGCSAGPTLVGFTAGAAGGRLQAGLLPALVFPMVILLGALVLRRRGQAKA